MKNPQNQHQLVLWYLYNNEKITLTDVINDSMFYKFQTRLNELEIKYGDLTTKERVNFTNRFGHKGSYFIYSTIDKSRVLELYEKLQENKKNLH